jgi:hypothetical protein
MPHQRGRRQQHDGDPGELTRLISRNESRPPASTPGDAEGRAVEQHRDRERVRPDSDLEKTVGKSGLGPLGRNERPAANAPSARPPMNVLRIALVAKRVVPKISTSWRSQSTS